MKIGILKSNDGDWVGLYINGFLRAEGHSLGIQDVIHAVCPDAFVDEKYEDEDFFDENAGYCPERWPTDQPPVPDDEWLEELDRRGFIPMDDNNFDEDN